MALSRRTASAAVLTAARFVILAGVGAYWVAFYAVLLPGQPAGWAPRVAGLGLFLAAWGCISLVALCTLVFAGAGTGLDGAVGLAAVVPGCSALIGTLPRSLDFASVFFFLSAGVGLTVCGIFLAVLTLKTGSDQGGVHAHPQV